MSLTVFTHWYMFNALGRALFGCSALAFPLRIVYRFCYNYRCKVTTYMYNMQTFSTLFYFRRRKSPSPAPLTRLSPPRGRGEWIALQTIVGRWSPCPVLQQAASSIFQRNEPFYNKNIFWFSFLHIYARWGACWDTHQITVWKPWFRILKPRLLAYETLGFRAWNPCFLKSIVSIKFSVSKHLVFTYRLSQN